MTQKLGLIWKYKMLTCPGTHCHAPFIDAVSHLLGCLSYHDPHLDRPGVNLIFKSVSETGLLTG